MNVALRWFKVMVRGEFNLFYNGKNLVWNIDLPVHIHMSKNDLVEGRLRRLIEWGLTLLLQGGFLVKHWFYAFCMIVYLQNMCLIPVLMDKSLYEMLYNIMLNYAFIRTFGFLVLLCLRTQNIDLHWKI